MKTIVQCRWSVLIAVAATVALCAPLAAEDAEEAWPYEIDTPQGRIVVYQPQLDSFKENDVEARAAVSVALPGQAAPAFGAVWIKAEIATDRDTRMASIENIRITEMKFPSASDEQKQQLSTAIAEGLAKRSLVMSQDRLLALLGAAEKDIADAGELATTPPTIIISTNPAVLVTIDGDPKLKQVPGTDLMQVVNTPFAVVLDVKGAQYYLRGGALWFAAKSALGPWVHVPDAPAAVAALVTNAPDAAESSADNAPVPEIIVSTVPAELIVIDGDPEYSTIRGTSLLYVENTESDFILDINSQMVYVLLAGRWYAAHEPSGPWAYVPADKLPEDFARIPPDSARASVLANVHGTDEARDAVLDNTIPQTAAIPRGETNLPVVFDGEPKFEQIENTEMAYAVNTPTPVIKVENRYYSCLDGVWYVADRLLTTVDRTVAGVLNTALGTVWSVCAAVPPAVYTIPPSCPIYPVRYCYVYDVTP
ncbi:hypothetical protein GX586_03635, partial [bacterium]|nr:hypothetical protein [bacterium]